MTSSSLDARPLHAFVLLARGRPGVDHGATLSASGTGSVRYRPVGGHHAFLVVRPGSTLIEAAQLAEYDIQGALEGACWVLLCPLCDLPLSVASSGYSCPTHSLVLSHDLVDPVAEGMPAPRRRPSRHRSRSAHKREAMGTAWSRFLKESSDGVVRLPHLVTGGGSESASTSDEALGSLRSELQQMLDEASTLTPPRQRQSDEWLVEHYSAPSAV